MSSASSPLALILSPQAQCLTSPTLPLPQLKSSKQTQLRRYSPINLQHTILQPTTFPQFTADRAQLPPLHPLSPKPIKATPQQVSPTEKLTAQVLGIGIHEELTNEIVCKIETALNSPHLALNENEKQDATSKTLKNLTEISSQFEGTLKTASRPEATALRIAFYYQAYIDSLKATCNYFCDAIDLLEKDYENYRNGFDFRKARALDAALTGDKPDPLFRAMPKPNYDTLVRKPHLAFIRALDFSPEIRKLLQTNDPALLKLPKKDSIHFNKQIGELKDHRKALKHDLDGYLGEKLKLFEHTQPVSPKNNGLASLI